MQKVSCILLVDDDDITNSLHAMLLEDMAIAEDIQTSTNAEAALRMIQNTVEGLHDNKKCLLFLDINMPGFSGFELLEQLKGKGLWPSDCFYVYILSSSSNKKDLDEANNNKVDGYVVKPLTHEKIKQVFQEIDSSVKS